MFGMSRESVKQILLAKLKDSEIFYINDKGFYYEVQNSKIGDSLYLGSFNLCYYAEPLFYNNLLGEIRIRQFLDFDYSNVVSYFKVNSTNSSVSDIKFPFRSLYNLTKQILYSKYRTHDSVSILKEDYNAPYHLTLMFAPDFYIEADNAVGEINLKEFQDKIQPKYLGLKKLKPSDLFENQTLDFNQSPGLSEVPGKHLLLADIDYKCPSVIIEGKETYLYQERVQEQKEEKNEEQRFKDLKNERIKDSLENIKREMDAKENLKF